MQNTSTFKVYNASAGSGKTFTLVKEYLKILLSTVDVKRFQEILAVTFTNKAAAEMKERVIQNLKAFSKPEILQNKSELFQQLEYELSITDTILHQRSGKILQSILNNYAAFNITTIDSFTYRLIRNFAFDLGLSLNFDVEMDAKSILNEAVEVLISKVGDEEQLTNILIDFALQKTDDDKSWDISYELKDIAQTLLNENDVLQLKKLQEKPIQDFLDLKEKLTKRQSILKNEFKTNGTKGLEIINSQQLNPKDFYYSQIPKHFQNLIDNPDLLNFDEETGLAKSIITNTFYTKNKPDDIKASIDSIINPLLELYSASEKLFNEYSLNSIFLKSIIPLAVLNSIANTLNEVKEDKNIRLNAEFNKLISDNLQAQPVAYIYERIGEKFKHYFIDEMQDTSVLQWQNLVPLIANALSQENTSLLLVGDSKQSIYRWRGSEPEQFLNLASKSKTNVSSTFNIPKQLQLLDTNFRSYSEVINFNNNFFKHLSTFFNKPEYEAIYFEENQQKENSKKGGYVQLSFIEQGLRGEELQNSYAEKVLETILNLSTQFSKNEICILTRTRNQGVLLADFLTDNGIDIISSETLLLKNSEKVDFIINLLTYLQNNADKEAKLDALYFLHSYFNSTEEKHDFFKRLLDENIQNLFIKLKDIGVEFDYRQYIKLSLYNSVEYIIRSCKLNTTSDAHLQFFLDEIIQFSQKNVGDAAQFLDYWNDKKDQISIVVPEEKDAVRIMTIHKSKGLEFPVIIYPFDLDIYKEQNAKVWYPLPENNDFETLLVNYNKTLVSTGEVGKQLYESHRNELELDNFNLIYVALTRAIEQLYIIGEVKQIKDKPRYTSQFFIDYLMSVGLWNEHKIEYEFGSKKRISVKPDLKKNDYEFNGLVSASWQSHNITIVANSALVWDNEYEARYYGNLIHELLSYIKTEDDIEEAIQNYLIKGLIVSEQVKEIKKLLLEIVTHPNLKAYYTQNIEVFNEREILANTNETIIPDRLVINENNEAILIDYKTGKPEKKHHQQLDTYQKVVNQLGYKVIKKILVYIGDSIDIAEVKLI